MKTKDVNHDDLSRLNINPDNTSSGGTTEEDPPTAYNPAQQINSSESSKIGMPSDFRIVHGKINKSDRKMAPLFANVKGDVHYYLPYCSKTEVDGKTKEYRAHDGLNESPETFVDLYMSEVSVLYGGDTNTRGKEDIRHASLSDRNHIYLGHSIWFPAKVEMRTQATFEQGQKEPGQYVIHEVRPVYKFTNWSKQPDDNSFPERIPTKAVPHSFKRSSRGTEVDTWMVIARPISWTLKKEKNLYAVGIVDTPKGQTPQVYQDVEVYTDAHKTSGRNKHVEIVDRVGNQKKTVAIFCVVPCIKLL